MTEPITRIRTVYGDCCYVASADLAGRRQYQLPLYTKNGIKWTDTAAGDRAAGAHKATTLARGNIEAYRTEDGVWITLTSATG